MRAILPCAGYGSRMKMQPNQSKEMLLDSKGKPIIEYHLDLCYKYNITPLVITRAEKKDLIQYCTDKSVETLIIEPQREMPFTVLRSWEKWEEDNILLLPDTRFEPTYIIEKVMNDLDLGAELSIALHQVDDPQNWGIVHNYKLIEKPKHLFGTHEAFGIIGFKRSTGISFFDSLNLQRSAKLTNTSFQYLDSFRDITRTGIINV